MNHPLILSAVRTPIGRFHGGLSSLAATDLGAIVVEAAVARAGVSPESVDEVILGNVVSAGLGQAPARQAALRAGLPPTVPAVTVNKVCGSGLKAVALAAQAVQCGDAEVVVAGGMESMSRCPYLLERTGPKLGNRELLDALLHDGLVCPFSGRPMGEIADALAESDGIARDEQDRYAAESHRRAVEAIARHDYDGEIVPVPIATADPITVDEGPRADATTERLGRLRPAFAPEGRVTAGNASMISDGAAAVVVGSREFAERTGRAPMAEVLAVATSGTPPEDLFVAPVEAIRRAVERSGHELDDVDLFEINEAFAVQMLACLARLGIPEDRVNVRGGAIALGHPIGASGTRILVSLVHALRDRGARLGVAAACLGGGNAIALVVRVRSD